MTYQKSSLSQKLLDQAEDIYIRIKILENKKQPTTAKMQLL